MYSLSAVTQQSIDQLINLHGGYLLIDKQAKFVAVKQQFFIPNSIRYNTLISIVELYDKLVIDKYAFIQLVSANQQTIPQRRETIISAQKQNGQLVMLDEYVVEFVEPVIVEGNICGYIVYQNNAEVRKHVISK